MFAHHLLEVFDCLQCDIVFFVAKIHESAGVSAMFWDYHLDWAIWIDLRNCDTLSASSDCQSHYDYCNSRFRNWIDAHQIWQVLCKDLCV